MPEVDLSLRTINLGEEGNATFIEKQTETLKDEKKYKPKRSYYVLKTLLGIAIIACALPLAIYVVVINFEEKEKDFSTCLIVKSFRVPCGIQNITKKDCEKLDCCYDQDEQRCYHYLPSKYFYEKEESSKKVFNAIKDLTPLKSKSIPVSIAIQHQTQDHVRIILHDASVQEEDIDLANPNYSINLVTDPLLLEIYRASDMKEMLLSTTKGPLIASESYWEWTIFLTHDKLIGLGETLISLKEENDTITRIIYPNKKDSNIEPVFWAYQDEKFHGLAVKHEGPLEVTVLASNLIILKWIAGTKLELDLFVGPIPQKLREQMMNTMESVTHSKDILNIHLCRGSGTTDLSQALAEYSTSNSSLSNTECIHENLMHIILKKDFTEDSLKEALKDLSDKGKKLLISLPPQIPVTFADEITITPFYKINDKPYIGKYLDSEVYFLDFSHNEIDNFLELVLSELLLYIEEINLLGFVLTDDWPLNEGYEFQDQAKFTYMTNDIAEALSNTIPWDARSLNETTHIIDHMKYASQFYQKIAEKFPEKIIMSSTQIFGETGDLILENVDISWSNMKSYLNKVLFNSISGNTYVSVPVCGSTENYLKAEHESLCLRWYLLASTMPVFRVSSLPDFRNPENLNTLFSTQSAERAIQTRVSLQDYFQTIITNNKILIEPMFYKYYMDNNTFALDEQYMIGDLLIAHPFVPDKHSIKVYLPKSQSYWYEFWSGIRFSNKKSWISLEIVETDWVAFIREGAIVTLTNQDRTELNPIVALNCEAGSAEGALGDLKLSSTNETLTITNNNQADCLYNEVKVKVFHCEEVLHIKTNFDCGMTTFIINYYF